jgi:hypothetical protein
MGVCKELQQREKQPMETIKSPPASIGIYIGKKSSTSLDGPAQALRAPLAPPLAIIGSIWIA